jgi:hypothetical protein
VQRGETGKRKAGKIVASKEGTGEKKQWTMKPGEGRAKRSSPL